MDKDSLFGNLDDFVIQYQEWKDMPEFIKENQMPWNTIEIEFEDYFDVKGLLIRNRIIKVHFKNSQDLKEFANLIKVSGITQETKYFKFNSLDNLKRAVNQNITDKTLSIWFPKKEIMQAFNQIWISEEKNNIKYPVYIISKSRADSRLTSKALEKMNVPYRIVIEPQEYKEYSAVINPDKILQLPFSNLGQGSIPARNWVWEHSIQEGHKKHWILDDNISHFIRNHENIRIPVADGTIFRCCEDFTDRYSNVGISGMNYYMFSPDKSKMPPFYINTRIYSCILIRNDIPYRWRGRYNEDTDLSIRALKDGWCTILFNAFLCLKSPTMTMKGGNTDELYKPSENKEEDGRYKMAKSLVDQHPDITTITWKFNRWQHQVDYSGFKRNKLIKKEELIIEDKINNYGMILKQIDNINQATLTKEVANGRTGF